ncbi:MAG: hypothetical protein IPP60_01185 [Sphingobacteriales bacterium]|nr:hypothetical protein [Sphingobacteriales bacterium]
MKKILISFCMFLLTSLAIAQTGMPSQADMDKMMKQMQDAMKDMPPETKKMMDSMGMKMPDPSKPLLPKGMTVDNIQQKYTDMVAEDKAYRKKVLDEMPRKIFTDAELATFLQTCFTKIDKNLDAKVKENAKKIIAESKAKNIPAANSVPALLMMKRGYEGLWILSKLAAENPKDANLLCNYAAVSTICGASHFAIPILNNLNHKYPNNSSVLNNLGQAWYDFDKTDSTKKYLKLALKAYPYHPNANYTMSKVCGGNTKDIIGYLKDALKGGFSDNTASQLKKLGVKLTKNDVEWPFPDKSDPLGLDGISIPDYPTSTTSSEELEPKWKAFIMACKAKAESYSTLATQWQEKMNAKEKTLLAESIKNKKLSLFVPPYSELAAIYFGSDIDSMFKLQVKWLEDALQTKKDVEDLQESESKRTSEITAQMDKKYNSSEDAARCEEESRLINGVHNNFLAAANSLINGIEKRKIENLKVTLNAKVKLSLYSATTDERFEWEKAQAKSSFLQALAGIEYNFIGTSKCSPSKKKATTPIKLAEFPDPTCDSKFTVAIGVFKASTVCNKFSIEGGEGVLGSAEYDFGTGELEFGFGIGAEWQAGVGPLHAKAGLKLMSIHKWNSDGYTGGGLKWSGGPEIELGNALQAGIEGNTSYFINTQGKDPGFASGIETSGGVKIP